jgi:hypothetical protein
MTAIERNGLSGLALRAALIAFAAVMFGCAPKAPSADASTTAPLIVAARQTQ